MSTTEEEVEPTEVTSIPADAVDVELIQLPEDAVILHAPDVVELDPSVRDAQGTGDQTGGLGAL